MKLHQIFSYLIDFTAEDLMHYNYIRLGTKEEHYYGSSTYQKKQICQFSVDI
jgi:hypothetical protein